MTRSAVRDPDYEFRVRESFARQQFMATLGATLVHVEPGEVMIALPFHAKLTQQHDFLHAGVVASVLDSACGYAALTLMDPGVGVMSTEFKVNLLAPAEGNRFVAHGRVVRAGRTLSVCQGELRAVQDEGEVVVAILQGTMMAIRDREGITD